MKTIKRSVAGILSVIMVVMILPFNTVSAKEYNVDENTQITTVSSNAISIKTEDTDDIIKVYDNKDIRKVEINNIKNGTNKYILYNKSNNSIYSSITNNTIYLQNNNISNISLKSRSNKPYDIKYETLRISYADIKNIIGTVVDTAAIIAVIAAISKHPVAEIAKHITKVIKIVKTEIFKSWNASRNNGIYINTKTYIMYEYIFGVFQQIQGFKTYILKIGLY